MKTHERIREIREERHLTQLVIAQILNVGQRTYCDYESGKTRIPIDRLKILAKYYDLCIDYVCGASDIKRRYPRK